MDPTKSAAKIYSSHQSLSTYSPSTFTTVKSNTSLDQLNDNKLGENFEYESLKKYTLEGHNGWIESLAILDNDLLASGSYGTIIIWDLKTKSIKFKLEGSLEWVRSLILLSNRYELMSGTSNGRMIIWNLNTRSISYELKEKYDSKNNTVSALAVLNDCEIAQSCFRTIKVWDLGQKLVKYKLEGHLSWIWSLETKKTSGKEVRFLISGSIDGTIIVWDLKKRRINFKMKAYPITSLVSLDHSLLASASLEKIIVWDLERRRMKFILGAGSYRCGQINILILMQNDELACGCQDGSIIIWNLKSKSIKSILKSHHQGSVFSLAVGSNRELISGSADQNIIVLTG